MKERPVFKGRVVKMGNKLMITVPKAMHQMFPSETDVTVTKD